MIAEAKRQWQENMGILKNPKIPKTEQMQIDLATECAGLEAKIAKLEEDLTPSEDEELEDEEIQYEIYTLLPDLLDEWHNLSYKTRLRFIGALARKVVVSHIAPGWLKIRIEWKIAAWGIDEGHLRRDANRSLWSSEEDAIIRELYPSTDAAIILEKLPDRTWLAIRNRALAIGVHRDSRSGHQNSIVANDPLYSRCSKQDVEYAGEEGLDVSVKNVQWGTA